MLSRLLNWHHTFQVETSPASGTKLGIFLAGKDSKGEMDMPMSRAASAALVPPQRIRVV